jgi:hypothetical protein
MKEGEKAEEEKRPSSVDLIILAGGWSVAGRHGRSWER